MSSKIISFEIEFPLYSKFEEILLDETVSIFVLSWFTQFASADDLTALCMSNFL